MGLRLRYNRRGRAQDDDDPPSIETGSPTMADRYFPHIVDSRGWSTQVILSGGTAGQASAGTLSFFDTEGETLGSAHLERPFGGLRLPELTRIQQPNSRNRRDSYRAAKSN